jgi:hypothetical protein
MQIFGDLILEGENSAQLELMFGLVELGFRGCQATLNLFFIFYLVSLWLGFIPKISFLACLVVPKKFVWWVVVGGGWVVVV